jgi:HD-GYP domain-containing protein (c-di-GMP phosphodiesterase class II)
VNTQHSKAQKNATDTSPLLQLVQDVGIALLHCDGNGKLGENIQGDWLVDLLVASPMVRLAISSNCASWNDQVEPKAAEAFQGVWLVPVRNLNSRRGSGFTIGVLVSDALCTSEYLHALCQASGADTTIIRDMIRSLNPVATQDVQRVASMFQFAWNAQTTSDKNQQTSESVGQELADSYEEINLLYTITGNMNSVNHPKRFISLACEELLQTLPYEWIGVQLRVGERLPRVGNELIFAGNAPADVSEVVQSAAHEIGTTSIVSHGEDSLSTRLGKATIIEPILSDGTVIGVLVAANKQGVDNDASSVDIQLLAATAAQLAIFLENALLYEDLNATFLGTLEALTASIDAKDKYTCGHSQRVALLTAQLAEKAGLNADQIDRCRIAGLVHDIGKIGVPEKVLTKKGGLTNKEFVSIQKHPEIGANILKDIPQMEDILGGVLHHHEKYGGGGYPHGIAGNDIPLVARMISLADTFDAMSSSRTYRNAMNRDAVLSEMMQSVGSQFDPELAELFFALDFSAWEQLMITHQVGRSNSAPDPMENRPITSKRKAA